MENYLRLLSYLRPYKGLFLISGIAMVTFSVLDAFSFALLIPFLDALFAGGSTSSNTLSGLSGGYVGRFVESVVLDFSASRSPLDTLKIIAVLILGTYVVKSVAAYVHGFILIIIESRINRDIRKQIYNHIIGLDFSFFQRTQSGQIIQRITSDVDQVRNLVTGNLSQFLTSITQIVVFLTLMLALSWKLTLSALIGLPIMLAVWSALKTRLKGGIKEILHSGGVITSHVQESILGIRLLKSTGAERWEEKRFQALVDRQYSLIISYERLRKLLSPASEIAAAAATILILLYGSHLVVTDGSLEPSELIVTLAIGLKLLVPAKWLSQLPSILQPGLAAAQRAFELLDIKPVVVEAVNPVEKKMFHDKISYKGVSFEYEAGRRVLRDISLDINRGEVVALVGPSGAGKSTMADLLKRFYDPSSGSVEIDGVDLRSLSFDSLHSLISVVPQETVLFHATVRENIAYAIDNATDEQIVEAAKAANAHEFIEKLPQKYDTVLGERGTRLSGGQRQRIAIARALLRNTPILILDEATSALDNESENLVKDAIHSLMEGRTVLVIAHRLSTVYEADKIVLIENGAVSEIGTHTELLKQEGLYRKLYELQFQNEL